MRLAETVTFGGGTLDRAAHLRASADGLLVRKDARVVALWRGKPLMRADRGGLELLAPDHAALGPGTPRVFLGLADGAPRFGADLSKWQPDDLDDAALGAFHDLSEQVHPDCPGAVFAELRGVMAGLDPLEAELAATAKAILGWHRTHRFCSACSVESDMADAGWQRQCPDCGTRHFPRTDPVVIMLITRANKVLLGRSPGWPEGMFSLLAGFVEPGETLEAATRRETFEEAGVRVGAVDYLACQPWPFPSTLMVATRGEALGEAISIDPAEIEQALWVSRETLLDVYSGNNSDILPARNGSIAHFILRNWLADRLD